MTRLEYRAADWLGDAILECTPCFVVTEELGATITAAGGTGVELEDFMLVVSDRALGSGVRTARADCSTGALETISASGASATNVEAVPHPTTATDHVDPWFVMLSPTEPVRGEVARLSGLDRAPEVVAELDYGALREGTIAETERFVGGRWPALSKVDDPSLRVFELMAAGRYRAGSAERTRFAGNWELRRDTPHRHVGSVAHRSEAHHVARGRVGLLLHAVPLHVAGDRHGRPGTTRTRSAARCTPSRGSGESTW
ncbi:hypothetical protein NLX83_37890 [Allokutzneria sp. A3M-2-11 16]|uniref:hypothetical protein n=1 Tax=Allokutzneria sp. A3M-2-11 16 TaxID=2962043 RepID=UPI0020B7330C|nr:hypothetical protein [Allokutzneria sp. A3M-2-11 16]MCP3805055.1 hypothetical protein [Allokutzneria sp. A3M-2-11 16]